MALADAVVQMTIGAARMNNYTLVVEASEKSPWNLFVIEDIIG